VAQHEVAFMIVSFYQGVKYKKPVVPSKVSYRLCNSINAALQGGGDNVAEDYSKGAS
jgi:hypothetical protein